MSCLCAALLSRGRASGAKGIGDCVDVSVGPSTPAPGGVSHAHPPATTPFASAAPFRSSAVMAA